MKMLVIRVLTFILEWCLDQLLHASKTKAYKEQKHACRYVINLLLESPGYGQSLKDRLTKQQDKKPIPLSEDEGLAFYLDGDFSQSQYQMLRNIASSHNAQIYPSYYKLQSAVNRCIPPNIVYTENKMTVDVQSVVSHVGKRICTLQHDVIVAGAGENTNEGKK